MAEDKNDMLFNVELDKLKPDDVNETYLEQYKIYLELADKLSDRRQTANSFFLTLNTGLCASLAFLCAKDRSDEIKYLHLVIPFAGIFVSAFWYRLVASYRQLASGKFEIVHRIEKHLPIAPYDAEWEVLGRGNDSKKYKPLTHLEVWIPKLFIMLYALLFLYLFPWSAAGARFHPLISKIWLFFTNLSK